MSISGKVLLAEQYYVRIILIVYAGDKTLTYPLQFTKNLQFTDTASKE